MLVKAVEHFFLDVCFCFKGSEIVSVFIYSEVSAGTVFSDFLGMGGIRLVVRVGFGRVNLESNLC